MRRLAILLIAGLLAVPLAGAATAEAGIRFSYSSGHWRIGGHFGGSYFYRPYYYSTAVPWYSYGYGFPSSTYYYSLPYYPSLPLTRVGNLPYIPPGTIYSVDSSAYRRGYYGGYYPYGYGYPYGYPYGGGFAASYLDTAPGVGTSAYGTAPAASSNVGNQTQVIVQVNPAEGTETRVRVREGPAADGSWRDGLWRVGQAPPSAEPPATGENAPAQNDGAPPQTPAERSAPPAEKPTAQADTEAGHVYTLMRGTDAERLQAARALKRFDTVTSIRALTDALARDGDAAVRQAAAESLGQMLARRALADLWKAAREDPDANVRRTARDAALKIEAYNE